jgi:hypothetical protein
MQQKTDTCNFVYSPYWVSVNGTPFEDIAFLTICRQGVMPLLFRMLRSVIRL